MNYIRFTSFKFIAALVFPLILPARQQRPHPPVSGFDSVSVSIPLFPQDSVYWLRSSFIDVGSERVRVDSLILLNRSVDYDIDYILGKITLHKVGLAKVESDSLTHRLLVEFSPMPFSFAKEYSLREMIVRRDSSGRKQVVATRSAFRFAPEELFEKGFQKSGSLMRGFSVGSNQDLSLNSGFRMQLNGALSKDLDVTAALTDENSPIQPEGTTQSLREVDKVFIELRSRRFAVTLGDFNVGVRQDEGGEFGQVFRKLQGAKGSVNFTNPVTEKTGVSGTFTAATARGKFSTNYFQGSDGNQGPYRLSGNKGVQRIIILAGTERVYLNGDLVVRGETNDYTIDYASGEIFFTSRRLITNASRITIDFEYSDQQYTRNLLVATARGTVFDGNLRLNAVVAQEADDPDSPIDFNLDDTARSVLSQSGTDPLRASLPGIRYVGVDSSGTAKGIYLKKDTLINGKIYSFLQYAPGDPNAYYTASFTPIEPMPPDSAGYIRIASGQYQFAGLGQGSYLPVQLLPMPQLHRTMDINGDLQVTSDLRIAGEYAASRFDKNRFSASDVENNSGGAVKLSLNYNPKNISAFGQNIGNLDFTVSERFIDRKFLPLDRFNEVEFDRKWNLPTFSSSNEEIREASIAYVPVPKLRLSGGYGFLERTGAMRSLRSHGEASFKDSLLPSLQFNVENIVNDNYIDQENSTWLRQRALVSYHFGIVGSSIRMESEDRSAYGIGADSLNQGAFRSLEVAPRLSLSVLGPISSSVEIQARTEDSSSAGEMRRAYQSLTQSYDWQLSEWKSLTSLLSLSVRSMKFTEEFKKHGNADGEFILVRSQSRYAPLQRAVETDLYYEFSSQRSSRQERVFLRVPKGTGNYRYKGDLNGNGITEENEFELTRFDGDYIVLIIPSDRLYPVVDLKSSLRVRLQPGRILRNPSSTIEKVLRAISTETYLRIEERSSETDTRRIYLLNLSHFQNDKTTIAGSSQIQQDLFLFENSTDLSMRFRYNQRDGFTQFVSANERSLLKERSFRIRSQLSREIGNQTDFSAKLDRVNANVPTSRERNISSNSLNSDFSYRPLLEWEIGLSFAVSQSVDDFETRSTTADLNIQGIRVAYGFIGAGQLRGEFSREEVVLSNARPDPLRGIPFELTNGRVVGKNYLWQLAFDYRINQNMQVSFQYNGRSEGGRPSVHNARAEAKAFF